MTPYESFCEDRSLEYVVECLIYDDNVASAMEYLQATRFDSVRSMILGYFGDRLFIPETP